MSIISSFSFGGNNGGGLYVPCVGREMEDEVTTAIDVTTTSSFELEKGSIFFIIPPKYVGIQRREIAYQPFSTIPQTNSAGWTLTYTDTGNLTTGLYKVFDGSFNTYWSESNMIQSNNNKAAYVTIDFGGPLYSIKQYVVEGCCARVRLDGIREDGTKVYLAKGQTPTYYESVSIGSTETLTENITNTEVFKGVYLTVDSWSSSQDSSIIRGISFTSEEVLSVEKTSYTQPHLFINGIDTGIINTTFSAEKGYCIIYNGVNWDSV